MVWPSTPVMVWAATVAFTIASSVASTVGTPSAHAAQRNAEIHARSLHQLHCFGIPMNNLALFVAEVAK